MKILSLLLFLLPIPVAAQVSSSTATSTVIVENFPINRNEALLIVGLVIFILSITMFDRLMQVTSRSYDI